MSDDLAAWLRAQFDKDEETATGLRSMVRQLSESNDRLPPDSRRGTHVYDAGAWALDRVLAEIAAKRKRLAMHRPISSDVDAGEIICAHCTPTDDHYMGVPWPCDDVLLDAAPYAGRPGWLDEWKAA